MVMIIDAERSRHIKRHEAHKPTRVGHSHVAIFFDRFHCTHTIPQAHMLVGTSRRYWAHAGPMVTPEEVSPQLVPRGETTISRSLAEKAHSRLRVRDR